MVSIYWQYWVQVHYAWHCHEGKRPDFAPAELKRTHSLAPCFNPRAKFFARRPLALAALGIKAVPGELIRKADGLVT